MALLIVKSSIFENEADEMIKAGDIVGVYEGKVSLRTRDTSAVLQDAVPGDTAARWITALPVAFEA